MNTKRVLLLATSRNANIKCGYKTANCLIIREFVGSGGGWREMQRLRPRCSSHCRSMSPKSYSLPQIVKFQPAKIGKIQKLNGKNSNYFQIFRPANILLIVIILNLDYIEGYTQRAKFEFKRFCEQCRFIIQPSNVLDINNFSGEI